MSSKNNIRIIQGGRADFQVYQNDEAAVSVSMFVKNDETGIVESITETYVDGVAQLTLDSSNITDVVGVYSYQINEDIPDSDPIKYGITNCSDCEFSKIIICESIDDMVS